MNIYACSRTIRMWNPAQITPRGTAKTVPQYPAAAIDHKSREMISPAYMLPKSRSECDRGFEMYSTRLNRRFGSHSSTFEPKGVQNSSWIQPPRPFTAIEK